MLASWQRAAASAAHYSMFRVNCGSQPETELPLVEAGATSRRMDEPEQQRQAVVIRELQHRLRNLFAIVEAVATRSLTPPTVPAAARDSFLRRLHDLAAAYDLSHGSEEGMVLDVLRQVLKVHEARIEIMGCELKLRPDVLQDIVLIVHELHTNSMKYGALSDDAGCVRIVGRMNTSSGAKRFEFLWQEAGGPPVSPPETTGYGQFLLQRVPEYSGGVVVTDYRPEGLRYSCSWPLAAGP
jgi:two-component sensor histidine kinase